jgi:hypothetical protein
MLIHKLCLVYMLYKRIATLFGAQAGYVICLFFWNKCLNMIIFLLGIICVSWFVDCCLFVCGLTLPLPVPSPDAKMWRELQVTQLHDWHFGQTARRWKLKEEHNLTFVWHLYSGVAFRVSFSSTLYHCNLLANCSAAAAGFVHFRFSVQTCRWGSRTTGNY